MASSCRADAFPDLEAEVEADFKNGSQDLELGAIKLAADSEELAATFRTL